jgi:1-deoxy-D-xylulose-5-phosphate reductoisomerase
METFSCLRLAREAGLAGGTAPCTLNAANEIAVHAFLGGRIRFLEIAAIIDETLARLPEARVHSFETLARADGEARRLASELVRTHTGA